MGLLASFGALAVLACSTSDQNSTPTADGDAEAPAHEAGREAADAGEGTRDGDADADAALPPPTYDFTIACTTTPCVKQVAGRGGSHACAVLDDGSVRCWGSNDSGQLGTGLSDAEPMPAFAAAPRAVTGITDAASVAVAGNGLSGTTCVVSTTGVVSCFGSDASGQLGQGSSPSAKAHPVPAVVGGLKAKSVALANTFAFAVGTDDHLWSWGANDTFQLASTRNDAVANTVPALADRISNPARAFAGTTKNGFVLSTEGGVLSWGSSVDSQLARASSLVNDPVPSAVALSDIAGIASGASHVCALSRGGGVYCWGANDHGQLGISTLGAQRLPAAVLLPDGVQAVAVFAGGNDTCIIAANGDLHCWGANQSGQLGTLEGDDKPRPQRIAGLDEQAVSAAIMDGSICALLRSGRVACWGDNLVGQLGRGARDETIHVEPAAVAFE
ncbi:regulator of chromosome condensation RCC1 [Labilithrix luteola]|uniref:Regulator of chromosome condensation RCC1 n=1 Tax=Labilithrix luteola TaxID=1391654 RepID=A0A0K1Q3U5_9BACT|nr:regulator of chromosome condensation RCC1 [Labilithrix luteola]